MNVIPPFYSLSFTELPEVAFILLYCVIVLPHLDYTMEADFPIMLAEWFQRYVKGSHHALTQPLLTYAQTPSIWIQ